MFSKTHMDGMSITKTEYDDLVTLLRQFNIYHNLLMELCADNPRNDRLSARRTDIEISIKKLSSLICRNSEELYSNYMTGFWEWVDSQSISYGELFEHIYSREYITKTPALDSPGTIALNLAIDQICHIQSYDRWVEPYSRSSFISMMSKHSGTIRHASIRMYCVIRDIRSVATIENIMNA